MYISRKLVFKESYIQKMEEFQQIGHLTTFQWVLGYSSVIGNEKANLSVQNRAEKGGKLTERWSLLAYIKKNMYEIRTRNMTRWHEMKT